MSTTTVGGTSKTTELAAAAFTIRRLSSSYTSPYARPLLRQHAARQSPFCRRFFFFTANQLVVRYYYYIELQSI